MPLSEGIARNAVGGIVRFLEEDLERGQNPAISKILDTLAAIKSRRSADGVDTKALSDLELRTIKKLSKKVSDAHKSEIQNLKKPNLPLEERIQIWTLLQSKETSALQEAFKAAVKGITAAEEHIVRQVARPILTIEKGLRIIMNQHAELTSEEKKDVYMAKHALNKLMQKLNNPEHICSKTFSSDEITKLRSLYDMLNNLPKWNEFKAQEAPSGRTIVAPGYNALDADYVEFMEEIGDIYAEFETVRQAHAGTIENVMAAINGSIEETVARVEESASAALSRAFERHSDQIEDIKEKADGMFKFSLADMIVSIFVAIVGLPITIPMACARRVWGTSPSREALPAPLTESNLRRLGDLSPQDASPKLELDMVSEADSGIEGDDTGWTLVS